METPRDPGSFTLTKANLGKRLFAYVIDAIIAGVLGAVASWIFPWLGGLVGAAYFLLRDGLEFDFMNRRSVGKHVLKLRPVRLDGAPMDMESSIRRNWMFALGGLAPTSFMLGTLGRIISVAGTLIFLYEVYRVFTDPGGRRWGDELAGTQVIEETL